MNAAASLGCVRGLAFSKQRKTGFRLLAVGELKDAGVFRDRASGGVGGQFQDAGTGRDQDVTASEVKRGGSWPPFLSDVTKLSPD